MTVLAEPPCSEGATRAYRPVFLDAGEMYLRTVYEMEESGEPCSRQTLPDRLGVTRSAVVQRLDRLVAEQLVETDPEGRVVLTRAGRSVAYRVMRRHRLAERVLVDLVGLEWELAHAEATRWQHVLGERAERRLLAVLGDPTHSPFGNPIPALAELDPAYPALEHHDDPAMLRLDHAVGRGVTVARLRRVSEGLQRDHEVLRAMRVAGIGIGTLLRLARDGAEVDLRALDGSVVTIPPHAARGLLVEPG